MRELSVWNVNRPETRELAARMRKVVDELGLEDVPIPPGQVLDPVARLVPGRGRDPERTPMPWDGDPGAGFSTGRPWLPVGDGNRARNVAAQRADPASMLTLHRRLLRLRRQTPALVTGAYHRVEAAGDVLAYVRADPGARWLVALNLGPSPARRPLAGWRCPRTRAATASRSAGRWSWRVTRAWSSSSTEGRRDHSATMGRLCPPACREDLRRARHPQ